MPRAAFATSILVLASCSSFAAEEQTSAPAGDASAPSNDDAAAAPPDASPLPDAAGPSACKVLDEGFDDWPAANGWGIIANSPASVSTVNGWKGRALEAYFPVQSQGTVRAQTHRSFTQTGSCALDISFDVRLYPTADSARWKLLEVRGASGGVVQIDHTTTFWYLRAGNTQTQIAAPPAGTVGRMRLVLTAVGAHVEAQYTLDGAKAAVANDLATTIGDKADVLLGSEVAGATSGAIRAEIDDVRVAW